MRQRRIEFRGFITDLESPVSCLLVKVGKYLAEKTTATTAFTAVEVDVYVVIFSTDRFLDKWFRDGLAINP